MTRTEAEKNIINFALAAFADCRDYEPTSKGLTIRVYWDEDTRVYRLNAYNDAYKYEECKPLEIHGHFTELSEVSDRIEKARRADVRVEPAIKCQDVKADLPNLYDSDEILGIYDEAVLRMVAGLETQPMIDGKQITVTKLCLSAFKEQLRHDLKEADLHE